MIFDLMNEKIVKAILETIPIEITVIDENDEVIGWNQHETRIFKRLNSVLKLNFRDCHPKDSLEKVEKIVNQMKSGERDKARFWINLPIEGKPHMILIEFYALRDENGKYIGCLECTQDIEDLRHLEGQNRLLDEIK